LIPCVRDAIAIVPTPLPFVVSLTAVIVGELSPASAPWK